MPGQKQSENLNRCGAPILVGPDSTSESELATKRVWEPLGQGIA